MTHIKTHIAVGIGCGMGLGAVFGFIVRDFLSGLAFGTVLSMGISALLLLSLFNDQDVK